MALVSMRELLDHAAVNGYGIPAFNVNNLEQIRAIMMAADATDSPVIVQASAGARKYARPQFLKYLMTAALEQYPDIPVCIHQDHGTDPDICQRSIQLGMSSVMMDGSLMADGKTPASYEYNVDVTRRTVAFAHALPAAEAAGVYRLSGGVHGEGADIAPSIGAPSKMWEEGLLPPIFSCAVSRKISVCFGLEAWPAVAFPGSSRRVRRFLRRRSGVLRGSGTSRFLRPA